MIHPVYGSEVEGIKHIQFSQTGSSAIQIKSKKAEVDKTSAFCFYLILTMRTSISYLNNHHITDP